MKRVKDFAKRVQGAVEQAGNDLEKRMESVGNRLHLDEKVASTLSKSHVPLFLLGVELDEWSQATQRAHACNLSTGRCYVDVVDLPISSGDSNSAVAKLLELRELSDREEALKCLPRQESSTLRLFIDDTEQPTRGAERALKSLISQWRDTNPETGFQLRGSAFFKYEPEDEFLDRQMRNSAWAHILSTIRLTEDPSNGPQEGWRYPINMTEGLVNELLRLEKIYRRWRTTENWRCVFLLQYHHAYLNQFQNFLQEYVENYALYRAGEFDARKGQLRQWGLNQLTSDSYVMRSMISMSEELVAAVELVLEVTKPTLGPAQDSKEFAMLEQELRGSCKDQASRLQRMSDDLDHHLKFLDLNRNMRQSESVQTLTLLATVFLPLSLAAGVLSMSTRFRDLGDLLYDLFGVVVIIGAVVMLLLAFFLAISMVKEYLANHHKNRPRFIGKLAAVAIVPYGLLVLSSFLVGMFKDVVLGAKILGFGTLAYPFGFYIFYIPVTLIGGIAIGIGMLATFLLSFMESLKWRRQKEDDPEVFSNGSETGRSPDLTVPEAMAGGVRCVGDGDRSDRLETKTVSTNGVGSR